jgi:hypothetical protein
MDFSTGKYIAVKRSHGNPKLGTLNSDGQVVDDSGVVIYQIRHFDVLDGDGVRVGRFEDGLAMTDRHTCIIAIHEA